MFKHIQRLFLFFATTSWWIKIYILEFVLIAHLTSSHFTSPHLASAELSALTKKLYKLETGHVNKKLSRCWDSATCEPLNVLITTVEVQNSTFFNTTIIFFSRIRDHRIHYPGRLWHASIQYAVPSCHVPISTFCCTVWINKLICDYNPPTLQTDRQTDGRHACSICATDIHMTCRVQKNNRLRHCEKWSSMQ